MNEEQNFSASLSTSRRAAPSATRTEFDSMGAVEVPVAVKWGAQTQRAIENFPISGMRVAPSLVHALGLLKGAAARVNGELGIVPTELADAIASAADEVASGQWDDEFPVDVFQTGSGTSTNMNMNEVLAYLANDTLAKEQGVTMRVHANDHVNACQSSNDMFPSAIHLAALLRVQHDLLPALDELHDALQQKSHAFNDIVKSGRTHLMDATPVTLGQEFGGYAQAVANGIARVRATQARVGELPLGGTAVGTGINAHPEFASRVIARLCNELDVTVAEAPNHFEAQGARDALVELSGALRVVALSLYKIANDLRWMSSGPRTGLREIALPDLQPGSSIMPGKVNPVVPEAVCQVVAQVIGNDAAVAFGGSAGNFELNVMLPVIARNILESLQLLSAVSRSFARKCISGITANVDQCFTYALSSPSTGTALNARIGYDEAARVIKQAVQEQKTIRDVVIARKLLTEKEADRVLDVLSMTKGGFIS